MSRAATSRIKVNPPLGRTPTLQFCRPAELHIDPAYQRDIAGSQSQALIRKIAMFWNWDLCQPLIVARRQSLTEQLYVVDGQHRLAAARMRGDIDQLPCVITSYPSAADEAASFVHLNQQRRPLGKLDVFKAALASEDSEACAIMAVVQAAGLSIAPHSNHTAWKPGMLQNIGGLEAAWRKYGAATMRRALGVLARAWPGEVLRYAGSVFPGIAAVCDQVEAFNDQRLAEMVAARSQLDWRGDIAIARAANPNLKFNAASAAVFTGAWARIVGVAAPRPVDVARPLKFTGDKAWCAQCEMMVARPVAEGCKSRFCSLKVAA